MDKNSQDRQEALLRSILAHQIAFNHSLPELLDIDENKHQNYLATYEKVFNDSLNHYLNEEILIKTKE